MKIEDYSPDELAEIFKEELDRLGIPYHYDLNVETKCAPLMPDEPVLDIEFIGLTQCYHNKEGVRLRREAVKN